MCAGNKLTRSCNSWPPIVLLCTIILNVFVVLEAILFWFQKLGCKAFLGFQILKIAIWVVLFSIALNNILTEDQKVVSFTPDGLPEFRVEAVYAPSIIEFVGNGMLL